MTARHAFYLTLALIFFCSAAIFVTCILPADSFHWDESHHALYGLWLANDLRLGDWDSFWANTHHQALWPFFHSWLLAIFFLVFKVSFTSARFCSLVLFALTAFFIYQVSGKIRKQAGWQVGLLAVIFFLTSPLMVSFAAQNMLEMLGALELVLAVYCYLLAEEKKAWPWYLLTGVILGLTVVTKYNYAFLILASFAVINCLDLFKGANRSWLIKAACLAAPVIVIAWWWFTSDDPDRKWQMLFWSKHEVADNQQILGSLLLNLWFYPQAIVKDYFFSPWLGLLSLAALVWAWWQKNNQHILTLNLIVWTTLFLSIFIIGNKMNRLIFMVAPLIFILLATMIVLIMDKRRWHKGLLALLIIPLVFSLPWLVNIYLGNFPTIPHGLQIPRSQEKMADVLTFFHDTLPKDKSFSTGINIGGYISPYVLYFFFHDWRAPFYTPYQANNPGFLQSPFFITVEIAQPDKYPAIDDSVNKWNSFLRDLSNSGKINLFKEKQFKSIGVIAKIYSAK